MLCFTSLDIGWSAVPRKVDDLLFGGIDPTASPRRKSACAVLDEKGHLVSLDSLSTDEKILEFFGTYQLSLWAIGLDAPCTLPLGLGRCCLEDIPTCRCQPIHPWKGRLAERELLKRGIRAYVISKDTFAKRWIRRGLQLKDRLQAAGYQIVEVFPHGTRYRLFPEILQSKSSRAGRKELQTALRKFIPDLPPVMQRLLSHDELDALLAALTVQLLWKGQTEAVGDPEEGQVIIPRASIRWEE